MTLARQRQMMTTEMVEHYTGYSALIIKNAVRRGELTGERPGRSPRSRLYFDLQEVERWLDSIAEDAS